MWNWEKLENNYLHNLFCFLILISSFLIIIIIILIIKMWGLVLDDLKGPLETHIKNYNAKHPGLLKIIRHQKRQGLTQARISGWEASTADVVVILDAHIEVNMQW